MANIFLDTNFFFDIASRKQEKAKMLLGHNVSISPLSPHIYCYAEKLRVPDKKFNSFLKNFSVENLTSKILGKALSGPTNDLEDNIQLHSTQKAKADYFLTTDKKLLKLGYFGKTKIAKSLKTE